MGSNQAKQFNNNQEKLKPVKTAYVHTMNEIYAPPTFGQSMREIFAIIGTNTNFVELAKPKGKRLFKDKKGTFMEQEKKKKGKKTIAE